ncbi:MAG: hypothetical protein LBK75_08370 [Oscillospiraceae bacterium]|nr:hypothetical protein [Oscillospiraceae bacterium]
MDIGILHTDYNNNNGGATTGSSDPLLGLSAGTYDPTRDNRGLYWQDMSLQNNGYTYDYFAPRNLTLVKEAGVPIYANGELLPTRVGYQALIVYQDAMEMASAKTLLELAQEGLPIIFVDNVFEDRVNNNTAIPANDTDTNKTGVVKAASRTLSLGESDADLQVVVDQIKALPNVKTLTDGQGYDPSKPYDSAVLQALQDLGIYPHTELIGGIKNIYTQMRKTDGANYVYVYNAVSDFDYNGVPMIEAKDGPATFNMSVDVAGKPYMIDTWTGDITEVADYTIAAGRTSFNVTLQPGATAYFALDPNDAGDSLHAVSTDADRATMVNGKLIVSAAKSGTYTTTLSNGSQVVSHIAAPGANIPLTDWSLVVDSYTNGAKVVNIEDRGLGYVTKEAWYPTVHALLGSVQLDSLKPWKDIPEIGGGVSGVGYYTTTFTLPDDWNANTKGAYLDVENLNGNTAQVFVNGLVNSEVTPINTDSSVSFERDGKVPGFDFVARRLDISAYLKPGVNTITISVASTLENVIRYLGTQNGVAYGALYDTWTNKQAYADASASSPWQSYGMVGDVEIVTYGKEAIAATTVGVRAGARTPFGSEVEYTFGAQDMETVNLIELTFRVGGDLLSGAAAALEALNGFAVFDDIRWQDLGNNQWQGKVILGILENGQTKTGAADVAKLKLDAVKLGDAKVTLTAAAVYGIDIVDGEAVSRERVSVINPATAVTKVVSVYDANGDDKVDLADLSLAFYYYQSRQDDVHWESAKVADVNGDNIVDMRDLVEIYAHFIA